MTALPSHRSWAKRVLGRRGTVLARCLERGLPIPRWGNLRRTAPFSDNFGFDRGRPVDRHYLEQFLAAHAPAITGDVLEIQLPGYTRKYGFGVTTSHTIDINDVFAPTYCCDLADARAIPSNRYDCFLLPNTLCVLRDIESCLREAYRVVRPGGTVIATTAAFVPLTSDGCDYWRLSVSGWREMAARAWPPGTYEVRGYGNVLAAVASMLGLAAEELTVRELEVHDHRYPVLVGLVCHKTAGLEDVARVGDSGTLKRVVDADHASAEPAR